MGKPGPDIFVHSVWLDAPRDIAGGLESILSDEERRRQAQFRFEDLRRDFAVAHGALRVLYAQYAKCRPQELTFSYGPKGKPAAANPDPSLSFNMSHSGRLASFAFSGGVELGIDVERIRPMRDVRAIAERFFCASEIADLLSLPPDELEAGFFRCWTRKEAYIKAVGDGLSVPLDSFQVSFLPGQDPALSVPGEAGWNLHNLEMPTGYAGALAYRGGPRAVYILPVVEASALPLE